MTENVSFSESELKQRMKYKKQILLFLSYFILAININAQNITLNLQNQTITTAFAQIESQTNYTIAYNNSILPTEKTFDFQQKTLTLDEAFYLLLSESDLKYEIIGKQILIVRKEAFEIFGIVQDLEYKEALTAAMVYVEGTNIGVTTNDYGYFSLKLLEDNYTIIVSYLGMKQRKFKVQLKERKRLNVLLEANEFGLVEVVVSEPIHGEDAANAPMNQKAIMELANTTPKVGGEPDLFHILRAKAGVQSSAGGIGGMYVRGGNTGHNLTLLDGVPVYNPMHLLGMNSIFSPNAVRGVQFHTSGFSARYGGRLASVIDIQSREGNPEKFSGLFGLNPRSYHGQLSGKLFNPNGAFWISGRQSFIAPYVRNILTDAFYPEGESFVTPEYYDFNIKLNQKFGKNDRLYLSYYRGLDEIRGETLIELSDELDEINENNLSYGNTIVSLRWNHIYGNNMFSNITINHSQFFNQYKDLTFLEGDEIDDENVEFLYSNIQSYNSENSVKADFDWINNNHQIKFGAAFHSYGFTPFFAVYDEDSEFVPEFEELDIDSFYNDAATKTKVFFHSALYAEDEFSINDRFRLRLGLRFTNFVGEDSPFYYHFEPRFALLSKLSDHTTATFSIDKMVQYLHLVSNADIGLPRDLWLPSNDVYEPAIAWHYNLDVQHKISNKWRLKSSIYYKSMDNLVTLPDTITAVAYGNEVTNQLLIGEGYSYGFEASAFYQHKRFTGFGTYAVSWANRAFEDTNEDYYFPFQFDTRHYLQLVLNYKINPNWQLGFRGHLSSPKPVLVSAFSSLEGGLEIVDTNPIGERNTNRGKIEHRLDFNVMYTKKMKKFTHNFSFEVYNIYNRQNPVFYYSDDLNYFNRFGMTMPLMISGYWSLAF